MSPDEIKAVIRRYFQEVFNNGNLAVADEVLANPYRTRLLISNTVQAIDEYETPQRILDAARAKQSNLGDTP